MSGKTGYILSTAGAVAVKNEKGKMSMQKVKVTRYVAGKRPDYAREARGEASSSDEDSAPDDDEEESSRRQRRRSPHQTDRKPPSPELILPEEHVRADPRLRRLASARAKEEDEEEDEGPSHRRVSHRRVAEPQLVAEEGRKEADEGRGSGSESEESDDEIARRREALKARAAQRLAEEEAMVKEEEESEEESSSSEEESSESESEDETGPRLKPVFVRKRDRVTLAASEAEAERLRQLQLEAKRNAEERKRQSAKMVESLVRAEVAMESEKKKEEAFNLEAVDTDDEDEEAAYEAWKLRELRRMKRVRDEREAMAKEKAEYDRIHNMSEEERRAYMRANPRFVTNKAVKGKYKFMQKYYHRGVFYLDEEDDTLKKDFAQPTLEDKFDKSVLPKVMQVKNFGMQGRTKWTHLVNEDTTDFQSAWVTESQGNTRFHNKHAGGAKDVFTRPQQKRKKIQ